MRRLLAGELTLENFWDLPHSRTAPTSSRTADARDWHAYQRYRGGGMISLTKRLSPLAGAQGMSWSDDGIEIIAPTGLDALLDGLLGRGRSRRPAARGRDVVEVVTRAPRVLGIKAYELDWRIWKASQGGALRYPAAPA